MAPLSLNLHIKSDIKGHPTVRTHSVHMTYMAPLYLNLHLKSDMKGHPTVRTHIQRTAQGLAGRSSQKSSRYSIYYRKSPRSWLLRISASAPRVPPQSRAVTDSAVATAATFLHFQVSYVCVFVCLYIYICILYTLSQSCAVSPSAVATVTTRLHLYVFYASVYWFVCTYIYVCILYTPSRSCAV